MRPRTDPLVKLLSDDEGWRRDPYKDSLGYWTIGVGHLIDSRKGGAFPEWVRGVPLTDDEVLRLVNEDVEKVVGDLNRFLPWWHRLTEARKTVLISMTFQLGMTGVLAFRNFVRDLGEENYTGAAAEMKDSRWAKQTPARVERLAALMIAG